MPAKKKTATETARTVTSPATKKATPKTAPAKASKKATEPKPAPQAGKLSCLDAAAQVLAKAGGPMSAKELIETMAQRKLWTSPGGKTPEATLYAAMTREIAKKGDEARFRKADRGLFVAATATCKT